MSNIELFHNGDNGTLVRQKINNSLSALNTDKAEKSANLSDLTDAAAARTNLDVDSKGEVSTKITDAINALISGAGTAYDTLLELQQEIQNNDTDIATILTEQAKKLDKNNNLSDLVNAALARSNLGVDSSGEVDSKISTAISDLVAGAGAAYDTLIELQNAITGNDSDIATILTEQADRLKISSNLADLANVVTARANLQVDSSSEVDGKITSAVNNLIGGASAAYDTLLELQNAITSNDSDISTILTNQANKLDKSNNLSDLTSTETARTNLDVDKTILSRAMTASEYRALAEQRKNAFAGSGFVEWGELAAGWNAGGFKGFTFNIHTSTANKFSLGASPKCLINGGEIFIDEVITSSNALLLPAAPDGLDKADGTGRFTDLNAAILAGGNDLSASVLKRQDLVLAVAWEEKISDKDVAYPLGNVQYGASSWDGITLSNTVVAQGYSAFGDWDTATKGYGVKWSTLTAAQQAAFINDPKNNIYAEDGELIQKRYRIRVIKGLGNDWAGLDLESLGTNANAFGRENGDYVAAQGKSTTAAGFYASSNSAISFRRINGGETLVDAGAVSTFQADKRERITAIPIALVTRLNQGAYHPFFNPDGTTNFFINDNSVNTRWKWYHGVAKQPNSIADCMKLGSTNAEGVFAYNGQGSIASTFSGRPDGKFYDAIYADQVKDLRNSAHKISPQELLEVETRKAIAGDYRGWERVPYTKFIGETVTVGGAASYQTSGQGRIVFNTSASDNPRSTSTTELNALKSDYWLLAGDNGATMRIKRLDPLLVDYVLWPHTDNTAYLYGLGANDVSAEFNSKFPVGTKIWIGAQYYKDGDNYFETLPMTNIIGSPQKIVDLMTAKGWTEIQGEWIPVVPDGTAAVFPLTRKLISGFTNVQTNDNGSTWGAHTGDYDTSGDRLFGSTANELQIINSSTLTNTAVMLASYTCRANGFELASNAPIECVSDSASYLIHHGAAWGSGICNDLIQKVNAANHSHQHGFNLRGYAVESNGKIYNAAALKPTHETCNYGSGNGCSKMFSYITEDDGRFYHQAVYREIKHDGTDWGDDYTFTITDNETVITDDNGALVLVGQKRRALPYFKGGN